MTIMPSSDSPITICLVDSHLIQVLNHAHTYQGAIEYHVKRKGKYSNEQRIVHRTKEKNNHTIEVLSREQKNCLLQIIAKFCCCCLPTRLVTKKENERTHHYFFKYLINQYGLIPAQAAVEKYFHSCNRATELPLKAEEARYLKKRTRQMARIFEATPFYRGVLAIQNDDCFQRPGAKTFNFQEMFNTPAASSDDESSILDDREFHYSKRERFRKPKNVRGVTMPPALHSFIVDDKREDDSLSSKTCLAIFNAALKGEITLYEAIDENKDEESEMNGDAVSC